MGGVITGWENVPYGSTPDKQEIARLASQLDDANRRLSALRTAVQDYLKHPSMDGHVDRQQKRETLKRMVSNG